MSFHIRVSGRGIVINNVPYINDELMEYIKTNNFSPVFIEWIEKGNIEFWTIENYNYLVSMR